MPVPNDPHTVQIFFLLGVSFITGLLAVVGWLGKRLIAGLESTMDRNSQDFKDAVDKLTEEVHDKVSYDVCRTIRKECFERCPVYGGRERESVRNSG